MRARVSRLLESLQAHQLQRFFADSMETYVLRHLGTLAAFTAMVPVVYHGARSGGTAHATHPTEYFLSCLHILVQVGMALLELQQYEEAGVAFDGIVEEEPDSLEAWAALGLCMQALGQPDAALACQRQVLRIKLQGGESES